MPSEQRLHPATLLFDLAKHARNFAVPAVLVIFGTSQSSVGPWGMSSGIPSGWESWLLVLFVPAAIASIVRYLTFRLRYDEHELVIRSGVIFRRERHVPFSRIQNVDAIQNVVHRLLGVVEVRIETGGGNDEEARLSVLPYAAVHELRARVFDGHEHAHPSVPSHPTDPTHRTHSTHPVLLRLPLREVLLFGFLENKGMVLIATAFGVGWESGVLRRLSDGAFAAGANVDRGTFRALISTVFDGGPLPIAGIAIAVAMVASILVLVRVVSMAWALVRLHDFQLTRAGEDLRTGYGLFTKVAATVPIRRVQAITIDTGPLHRLLKRASVRVATAGGTGTQQASNVREWLAPLIRQDALPALLQEVVPGFDLTAVEWQAVHPRAFARAVKPALIFTTLATMIAALLIGWGAIGVLIVMLPWSVISTRQYVAHLGWAEGDEVVMMRSGWISQRITLARVNKIQAVAIHQTPFDRRAAMARVRVDTAGAGESSHRVDIPYLDQQIAGALAGRLSAAAANTAFRW
jgi:putative membrane protein